MKRSLSVGRKSFSVAESIVKSDKFLMTFPRNVRLTCAILCDADHIISGTLCHYFFNDEEIIWEHCGPNDPCEKLDIHPRFSIIIPMQIKLSDGEKVIRNVRFPKSVGRQIESIVSRASTIKNLIVEIERDDSGDWTKYVIEPTGKFATNSSIEFYQSDWVDEVLSTIKAGTFEEIEAILILNGIELSPLGADLEEEEF